MLEFKIGDRVTFEPDGRASVTGMLTRYNKKTVTVVTEDGQHWNVSPHYLRKAKVGEPANAATTKVIRIK
jgi:hypothetical protein